MVILNTIKRERDWSLWNPKQSPNTKPSLTGWNQLKDLQLLNKLERPTNSQITKHKENMDTIWNICSLCVVFKALKFQALQKKNTHPRPLKKKTPLSPWINAAVWIIFLSSQGSVLPSSISLLKSFSAPCILSEHCTKLMTRNPSNRKGWRICSDYWMFSEKHSKFQL